MIVATNIVVVAPPDPNHSNHLTIITAPYRQTVSQLQALQVSLGDSLGYHYRNTG